MGESTEGILGRVSLSLQDRVDASACIASSEWDNGI